MISHDDNFVLTKEEIDKLLSSLKKFGKETGMNIDNSAFRPMTKEELDRILGKPKKHGEEVVDHPSHYNRENAMECIDEMVLVFGKTTVANFCLCNAWKYRYRAADKNGMEDLKKSDWYMQKYKELKNTFFSNDEKAWMGYTE